jgi:hypothetical protein
MDRRSDAETEVWKWVTGPEAELPLRGLVGSTTFPDYFAF